ncbi:MAG: thiamine S protein [Methanoregulaceae archaeon]|nr:thiamine S protein [Methanoregulaceae archaeon]
MKVILPDGSSRDLDVQESPIENVLLSLGINPAGVIVARNGLFVPGDSLVRETDVLRIYLISHGG